MDPVSKVILSQTARGILGQLNKLTQATYSEKLVARVVQKMLPELPRPTSSERKRIQKLLSNEDTWPLLIHPSRHLSDQLVDAIYRILTPERPPEENLKIARDLANLSVSEFIGTLNPDDRVNVAAELSRHIADQVSDSNKAINEVLELTRKSAIQGELDSYQTGDLNEYRQRLIIALENRAPRHSFRITYRVKDDRLQEHTLRDLLTQGGHIVTFAKAGAGKSSVVVNLAKEITHDGQHLVVFIDLKNLPQSLTTSTGAADVNIEGLLEASIVPLTVDLVRELHSALEIRSREIWFLDGVNELPREVSDKVIDVMTQHLRGIIRSSLCATDRSSSRYTEGAWVHVEIDALEIDEVQRQMNESMTHRSNESHYQELLRIPFFLEVALTDGRWDWQSGVEALHSLFADRVELEETDIALLSEFALSAYSMRLGLGFDFNALSASTGVHAARKLLESGILIPTAGDNLAFYHQLLHDYLASRAVSTTPNRWNPQTFDALSFDANTFEAIFMVVDQLDSEEAITRYLTALYDWNWFGTVRCVERAMREDLPIPRDLAVTLCAMLAEKKFDRVYGSRSRAEQWTKRLDIVTGFRFDQATTIADVISEVRRVGPTLQSTWFQTWLDLFKNLDNEGHECGEDEIALLSDPNPLVGWTASQMARWCHVSEAGMRQIRALFLGAQKATDDISRSVRWRVVHALGRYPSVRNSQLLLDAIDDDNYSWVVYGAVRSTLEMAAVSSTDITAQLLSEVDSRLANLSAQALSQISWVTRYEGAPRDWKVKVWPLLVHAYNLQTSETEKDRWRRRLDDFRSWADREGASEGHPGKQPD